MDITQLTAQMMTNRRFVDKLDMGPDRKTSYQSFLRDLEFYKERSIELAEALLNERDQVEPYLTQDVVSSFHTYMRACIGFFRMTDLHDINQKEEYGEDLSRFRKKTERELEEEAMQELDDLCGDGPDIPFHSADNVMMRQIQFKHNTLDRFLKYEKSETPIVLPKQKEIDLEHPDLKTKPFFQPPIPPPPPSIPEPSTESVVIDEVRTVALTVMEEIIKKVVDKLESIQEIIASEPEAEPPKKSNKKKQPKKKQANKKVETIHIDL